MRIAVAETSVTNLNGVLPLGRVEHSDAQNGYCITNTDISSSRATGSGTWKWRVCLILVQKIRPRVVIREPAGTDSAQRFLGCHPPHMDRT
ncbi:hypothetical protein AGR7A_pAt20142 [Agrobacterium deltaense NCPPB 1641]|uniref:Uncharacterized protein n=1 Tax=Agrobacterium deltaense NCPPB 1641 TaxID=1183425 RepID=A0A1S7U8T8_9HYPH|nr:hypothetical protein AGR7A_pAt20142 [Agrobacterium deltaense NCPPB 1641]